MSTQSMEQVIAICLVCRLWRDIALKTPELWNSLIVRVKFTEQVTQRVKQWFLRSGDTPRSLAVYIPGTARHEDCWADESCEVVSPELAAFLLDGPQRIDHISFIFPSSGCCASLVDTLKEYRSKSTSRLFEPWDTLKSLRIVVTHRWFEDYNDFQPDAMLQCLPPVSSLHLHLPDSGKGYPRMPGESWPPWPLTISFSLLAHLTNFTFESDYDYLTTRRILRQCRMLETLTLFMKASALQIQSTSHRPCRMDATTFDHLKTLRLRQMSPRNMFVLYLIDAPALVELDISYAAFGFAWQAKAQAVGRESGYFPECPAAPLGKDILCEFIADSLWTGTLRWLRLHGISATSMDVVQEILRERFRTLEHLVLDGIGVTPTVVEQIVSAPNTPLPHLKTLELRQIPVHLSAEFDEFLRRRRSGAAAEGPVVRLWYQRPVEEWALGRDENDTGDSDCESEFDSYDYNLRVRDMIYGALEYDYL